MDNKIEEKMIEINEKLDIIQNQNKKVIELLDNIGKALPQFKSSSNYSKAIEEFLNKFLNEES